MTRIPILFLALAGIASAVTEREVAGIFPPGVRLGMGIEDMKKARPDILAGPTQKTPPVDGKDPPDVSIFTEGIDLGLPSSNSYLYFVEDGILMGCMRTRPLMGRSTEEAREQTAAAFGGLALALGKPEQVMTVKNSANGWVKVRMDKWRVENGNVFLISTSQELSTMQISDSDFPLNHLLFNPDKPKLEVADPPEGFDIARPSYEEAIALAARPKDREKQGGSLGTRPDSGQTNAKSGTLLWMRSKTFQSAALVMLLLAVIMLVAYLRSKKHSKR